MKISIIGKGGAGKSTITSLISIYFSLKNFKVCVFDADINVHIKSIFRVNFPENLYLSNLENIKKIRTFLAGNNPRIDPKKYVKTTPPGKGSNFFTLEKENFILNNFSKEIKPKLYLFCVGSYQGETAGLSCYHTNLSIFENILSHSKLKNKELLIADMVAGIDSIANSLFLQFDLHFFIVEPNLESISVYNKYISELKKTDYKIIVKPILNKVINVDDLNFAKNYLEDFLILEYNSAINKLSKRLIKVEDVLKDKKVINFLEKVKEEIKKIKVDQNEKLKQLITLHKKYIQLDYVKRAFGDLSCQVDEEFKF